MQEIYHCKNIDDQIKNFGPHHQFYRGQLVKSGIICECKCSNNCSKMNRINDQGIPLEMKPVKDEGQGRYGKIERIPERKNAQVDQCIVPFLTENKSKSIFW